jgi:ABC-type Zn2+ transport system substrate-binding protein/surface adhesin
LLSVWGGNDEIMMMKRLYSTQKKSTSTRKIPAPSQRQRDQLQRAKHTHKQTKHTHKHARAHSIETHTHTHKQTTHTHTSDFRLQTSDFYSRTILNPEIPVRYTHIHNAQTQTCTKENSWFGQNIITHTACKHKSHTIPFPVSISSAQCKLL